MIDLHGYRLIPQKYGSKIRMAPEGRKQCKTNTTPECVRKTYTIGRWIHISILPITFMSFKIRLISIGYAKLKLGPFTFASGSDLKGWLFKKIICYSRKKKKEGIAVGGKMSDRNISI